MTGSLPGRTALVTGASGGLGRALVAAFVAAGANVVGVARGADAGWAIDRELANAPGTFRFHRGDVSATADATAAVDAAARMHGVLDIVINNAAVRTDPPLLRLENVDDANWDAVMDTNVKGPFAITRAAIPHMRNAGRGHIINIASITGLDPVAGMGPYSISKAALVHLTKATAIEGAVHGIRANVVVLGSTATGQAQRTAAAAAAYGRGDRPSAPWDGDAAGALPTLSTEAAAAVVLALCGDAMTAVTGASIAVDGGISAGLLTSEWFQLRYRHIAEGTD